ncbi:MAG: hypothetical protein ACKV22_23770 [Bryobacteraceae bacterium]
MRLQILTALLLFPTLLPAQRPPVIENEFVRVLDVSVDPGKPGRPHDHKINRVMIYMDAGQQRLAYTGAKNQDSRWRAGEVRWSPASGMHTSQNTGKTAFRVVEVELKTDPSVNRPAPSSALDPVKVDPKHYKVELENSQVRVIRFKNSPHGKIPMHEHSLNRVVVYLTPAAMKITAPDGKVTESRKQAGELAWSGKAKHSEENASDQSIELVVVEVK